MRKFAKISTSIWGSKKFGAVTDDARLLYFYLHTCPQANSVGCFVLNVGYAAVDLKWPEARCRQALDSLSTACLVSLDEAESVLRIIGFLRESPFTNRSHASGSAKVAKDLPDSPEKLAILLEMQAMEHSAPAELGPEISRLTGVFGQPADSLSTPCQQAAGLRARETGDRRQETGDRRQESSADAESSFRAENDAPVLALDGGKSADPIAEAVAIYNAAAEEVGWPRVQKITAARKAALKARLKDAGGPEGWAAAIAKARASPFLTGRKPTGRGPFFADFDFLTRESSFAKLMEGNYDPTPDRYENRLDPAFERIARAAGYEEAPDGSWR